MITHNLLIQSSTFTTWPHHLLTIIACICVCETLSEQETVFIVRKWIHIFICSVLCCVLGFYGVFGYFDGTGSRADPEIESWREADDKAELRCLFVCFYALRVRFSSIAQLTNAVYVDRIHQFATLQLTRLVWLQGVRKKTVWRKKTKTEGTSAISVVPMWPMPRRQTLTVLLEVNQHVESFSFG